MLSTLRSLLRGFGLTRDIEYVDLGTYGGRTVIGEARLLRLRLGREARGLTLGHARATRVEVTEGGRRTVLDVPVARGPVPVLAVGPLVLLLASALLTRVAHRGGER